MLPKVKKQLGFTLIEVIVVIALLAILATIVLVAINPAQNSADARNTKRRADVLQILNAVNQYYVANGSFPIGMPAAGAAAVEIKYSSPVVAGDGNICSNIVPTYIAGLPFDTGGKFITCTTVAPDTYTTKYTISRSLTDSRVTVSATIIEGGGSAISVTR